MVGFNFFRRLSKVLAGIGRSWTARLDWRRGIYRDDFVNCQKEPCLPIFVPSKLLYQ